MTNQQLRLSVGAPPGRRAVAMVVGVLVAGVGAAFVLLPLIAGGLLRRLTGPGDALASYEEARDLPPGMLLPTLPPSELRALADANRGEPTRRPTRWRRGRRAAPPGGAPVRRLSASPDPLGGRDAGTVTEGADEGS
ncbi:hypothetical protein [Micromonospora sp. WMMD710]|uniref:hypothetical protein n=1 Tax=Micromonospora sp. WMMD710 TaxID=3016085 RepID=UPI00241766D2|nr:hypothetical protein [Micromonospora sp. WMMD710]MDG4759896.1 hypothetical protein [Micromonospora sp. WMMD710]